MGERALILPAGVLAALDEAAAHRDRASAAADLMALGEDLLKDDDAGHRGEGHSLAMALGDALLYDALLVLSQYQLKVLSDEVWALEEQVQGERPVKPPADVPTDLQALTQLRAAATGSDEDRLERLCYGLAVRRASSVPAGDRGPRRMQAMSQFAAKKFALFVAQKELQMLGFRRAGLDGLLDGRRRREEIFRGRDPRDQSGDSK